MPVPLGVCDECDRIGGTSTPASIIVNSAKLAAGVASIVIFAGVYSGGTVVDAAPFAAAGFVTAAVAALLVNSAAERRVRPFRVRRCRGDRDTVQIRFANARFTDVYLRHLRDSAMP